MRSLKDAYQKFLGTQARHKMRVDRVNKAISGTSLENKVVYVDLSKIDFEHIEIEFNGVTDEETNSFIKEHRAQKISEREICDGFIIETYKCDGLYSKVNFIRKSK